MSGGLLSRCLVSRALSQWEGSGHLDDLDDFYGLPIGRWA